MITAGTFRDEGPIASGGGLRLEVFLKTSATLFFLFLLSQSATAAVPICRGIISLVTVTGWDVAAGIVPKTKIPAAAVNFTLKSTSSKAIEGLQADLVFLAMGGRIGGDVVLDPHTHFDPNGSAQLKIFAPGLLPLVGASKADFSPEVCARAVTYDDGSSEQY